MPRTIKETKRLAEESRKHQTDVPDLNDVLNKAPQRASKFLLGKKFLSNKLIKPDAYNVLFVICSFYNNKRIPCVDEKMHYIVKKYPDMINKREKEQCMLAAVQYSGGVDSAKGIECVKFIHSLGVDINTKYEDGMSLLMHASLNSHSNSSLEIVQFLLDNGANVNLQDDKGDTAFLYASTYSKCSSHVDTMKLLLKHGAKVDIPGFIGNTPFISTVGCSALTSCLEAIQLLLDSGADINKQGEYGNTALMYGAGGAGQLSDIKAVVLLLDNGADMNIQDRQGETALMYAAKSNAIEAVKLLLERGADVKLRNKDGKTAYDLCTNKEVFKEYINKMSQVNRLINNGKTDVQCPICCDNNKDTLILTCKHTCCGNCIEECLDSANSQCPVCRGTFTEADKVVFEFQD